MAEITQEKVSINDLVPGMFVSRLDRPWVGTPFPIQGFHLRNFDEIKTIGQFCKFVFIDTVKSRVAVNKNSSASSAASGSGFSNLKANQEQYEKTKTLGQEIGTAGKLHDDIANALDQVMEKVAAGKPVQLAATQKIATKMVNSIARNPDASIWIAKIKAKDDYTYSHAVRSSIWAITFGRHLELRRGVLENLALGMLLSEVGKTKLPTEILEKRERLNQQEFEILKQHVAYAEEILRDTKGINDDILTVVKFHHERHNGTGYPKGLKGDQIPLLGKIGGIVDFYDAITTPRDNRRVLSSSEAMAMLHKLRNEDFQGELVDEFVQAIGIYPTGTLIELSTGEVGVITEQNSGRRLRPKVMLLLDKNKQPLKKGREIDLLRQLKNDKGMSIDIKKSLPDGSYDIDLAELRKNFLSRFLGIGGSLLHN